MKKILVIEDEQSVREIILDILDAEGFDPIGAENGRIGVQTATEHLPDLIICDIMMPELDGRDVLLELRQQPATSTIPFVFLSAKADRTDLRQGMELGADDYLTKPFTRSEILQTIQTRLEKKAAIEKESQKKLEELRNRISLSLPTELRSPLNKIISLSEVFIHEHGLLEPLEVLEKGEQINQYARQLYRVVQNFLIVAKLEVLATNSELIKSLRNHQLSDPRAVISDVATYKAQEVAREVDLKLDLQDANVQISELKLKKIIEELVDNAFKFSVERSPVKIMSSYENNSYIINFVDQGRGMTAEEIANVGAYMQFGDVSEQNGSGLGLTIAKRLVELHGGDLTIESIPGKQTNVRVVLPCV
ncbi:hybrid sensor histidine kinase/response regulator [Crinalium epipsammum]